jgi:dihydrofolate reductase
LGLQTEEESMGKVVMNASVSVDGFIAAENDDPGPIFEWLVSGDVPLDDSGVLKVSQASFDYVRPYWDEVGVTIAGRHAFDITDGWDGTPPSGIDHVVVVSHRGAPEGWDLQAPFHFVDGIEAAVAKARELAGDRTVEFGAGDVGGQALLRLPRRAAPAGRPRRSCSGQPGASPALSGAPLTDLSGYAKKTAATVTRDRASGCVCASLPRDGSRGLPDWHTSTCLTLPSPALT